MLGMPQINGNAGRGVGTSAAVPLAEQRTITGIELIQFALKPCADTKMRKLPAQAGVKYRICPKSCKSYKCFEKDHEDGN